MSTSRTTKKSRIASPSEPEATPWRLYAHPAFREKWERLIAEVESLRRTDPKRYVGHPKTKLLKRLQELILREIPSHPNSEQYQLGNTLGPAHRHWRRAKFLGRFRLFYRFESQHRIIVYAWANDENTLRKAGARTDPYVVFRSRLRGGHPPDDWNALIAASQPLTRPK